MPFKSYSRFYRMIRFWKLLKNPSPNWESLFEEPPSALKVFFIFFLPILILSIMTESAGWYFLQISASFTNKAPQSIAVFESQIIRWQGIQLGLTMGLLILIPQILRWISVSFGVRLQYKDAFLFSLYALAPLVLVRFPDSLPWINTWICWSVGLLVSFRLLYHGAPYLLQRKLAGAFGFFMITFLVFIVLNAISHLTLQTLISRELNSLF